MANNMRFGAHDRKTAELIMLALIILLGAFLRLYQLDAIPVGLSGDEAEDGYVAKRILRGEEYPIFIAGSFGEEPMHTYLVAVSFALWGASLWAVRFFPAIMGIMTIPMVFWLAKELFPEKDGSASLVGLFSAFFVATSYWHIIYSRFGLEVITLPLFSSGVIYFLWRGLLSRRRWPFVISGLFLATSLYAYRGARFFPICLLLIFGGWLVASRELRRLHLANLILLVAVAIAVYSPLGLYAVTHPEIYFDRELHVSVLNPDWGQGSPQEAFGTALIKTAGMFNFQGDPEFDRNPGKRPVLDPISSLYFFVGLATVASRWRTPNHVLVILWFLIMSLPGAFTAEVFPHFHRAIGALPALVLLCALGTVSAKDWLARMLSSLRPALLSSVILSLSFALITLLSCAQYFVPWQHRLAAGEVTGGGYIEATAVMNTKRIPDGVWILPASTLRPRNIPYYEAYFLYEGAEPAYTVFADDVTTAAHLTEICRGHRQAAVINWNEFVLEEAYESLDSDPKGLIDFLLRKYGQRLGQEPHESFDLVTYRLPVDPAFAISGVFEPMDLNFGDKLSLEGADLGGSSLQATSTPEEVEARLLPSGKDSWVVLEWRALADLQADYKVAVYLLDSQGRVVGQTDKLLLSNYLESTSRWDPGQLELDYYTLSCQPATPPGQYTVQVAVYDARTMDRLSAFDTDTGAYTTSIAIAELQVIKPLTPAEVQPQERLPSPQIDIAPGLQLLGYDLPASPASPGDSVRLALYWRAVEDLSHDYLLSLELKDKHGEPWSVQQGRPVDGTYSTTEWEEGEVLRDSHDLYLPPDTPTGDFELTLRVVDREETIGEASLGSVEVQGRAHNLNVPEIQHPLQASLGDDILFLGYDLTSEDLKPGDTIHLILYWQALSETEVSYTVFTHLLDADERIWGQVDSIPLGGQAPTTSWVTGEMITDEYDVVVQPSALPGTYSLEIGMYSATTGERLPVFTGGQRLEGDRLLLGQVRVLP